MINAYANYLKEHMAWSNYNFIARTHPVAGNYSLVSFSSITSKKYVHCDTNAQCH